METKKSQFKKAVSKEVKPQEKKSEPGLWQDSDYSEFFKNRLRLDAALKEQIKSQGYDFRFINKNEFRRNGNNHKSYWKPYSISAGDAVPTMMGTDAEGLVVRGDLVLAVRPKKASEAHRNFLDKRNQRNKQYQKTAANKMRQALASQGISPDEATVHEGYEDNK